MNILKEKPYFLLAIEAKNIDLYVDVNGVTVFSGVYNSIISTSIPINPWVKSGINVFELNFRSTTENSPIDDDALIKLELSVNSDGNTDTSYNLMNIHFTSDMLKENVRIEELLPSRSLDSNKEFRQSAGGDVKIGVGKIDYNEDVNELSKLARDISLPINLPRWSFFDSDLIPDVFAMTDEEYEKFKAPLFEKYAAVQEAIRNNEIGNVLDMYEERNREYDAAFFYEPGTMRKKIKKALTDAATDSDLELINLRPNSVGFFTQNNNKLTKLVRDESTPAIVQNFKKAMGSQSFDLIFRYKNGKWILTR